MAYVIVSECEHGFWSNQYGWVYDRNSASTFDTVGEFPLTLRARHEGAFVDLNLAPEFYLEEPLLSGDAVVWDGARRGPNTPTLHVDHVRTVDGYARTSEDIVVLRDAAGVMTEARAHAVEIAYSA